MMDLRSSRGTPAYQIPCQGLEKSLKLLLHLSFYGKGVRVADIILAGEVKGDSVEKETQNSSYLDLFLSGGELIFR